MMLVIVGLVGLTMWTLSFVFAGVLVVRALRELADERRRAEADRVLADLDWTR